MEFNDFEDGFENNVQLAYEIHVFPISLINEVFCIVIDDLSKLDQPSKR